MPSIKSLRIIFHGYEHAQYFQGHGLYGTKYTHCATGAGSSHSEALTDALECLYLGPDLQVTDEMVRAEVLAETGKSLEDLEAQSDADYAACHGECDTGNDGHDSCELYYNVSIDVEVA